MSTLPEDMRKRVIRTCSLEDCNSAHMAKGYCKKHWQRAHRGMPLLSPLRDQYSPHKPEDKLEYYTWQNMKRRCNNPKDKKYHRYGGRGIKVCDRWMHSFPNFIADMGKKPTSEHEIDRINNDGNYTPENCRWATRLENCENRYTTVWHLGKSRRTWAEELGVTLAAYRSYCVRHGDTQAVEHFQSPSKEGTK